MKNSESSAQAKLLCSLAFFLAASAYPLLGQTAGSGCEPVTWTREQDHGDMMEQLGITALRPGPSGRAAAGAANAANYNPEIANPYPDLPDPLTLKDGRKVTTAEMWRQKRRPEIVEDFEREVVGRVPDNVPEVKWEVTETIEYELGGVPIVGKQLGGRADNSASREITVEIEMVLVVPKNAEGKVPVLMMFGRPRLPRPDAEPVPPMTSGSWLPSAGRGPSVKIVPF